MGQGEPVAKTEIKLFQNIIGVPNDPPALPILNFNIFCVRCAISMAQGASVRDYYWRRGHRFTNTVGAGCMGAPIYWRNDVPLRL